MRNFEIFLTKSRDRVTRNVPVLNYEGETMAACPRPNHLNWHDEVKITFDNHELGCFYESFAPLDDPLLSTSEALKSPQTSLFLDKESA